MSKQGDKKKARRKARKARQDAKRTVIIKDSQCRKILGSEFWTPEGLDAYRCDDPQHTHHTIRSALSGGELAEHLGFDSMDHTLPKREVRPKSLSALTEAHEHGCTIPVLGDEDLVKLWSKASDEERRAYCTGLALRVRECPDAPYSFKVRKLHRQMAMYGAVLTWEKCRGFPSICTHGEPAPKP